MADRGFWKTRQKMFLVGCDGTKTCKFALCELSVSETDLSRRDMMMSGYKSDKYVLWGCEYQAKENSQAIPIQSSCTTIMKSYVSTLLLVLLVSISITGVSGTFTPEETARRGIPYPDQSRFKNLIDIQHLGCQLNRS